jgi:xanthine dehydrogenase YagR molybdenum-binding subunit
MQSVNDGGSGNKSAKKAVGKALDRVDGRAKVTGKAKYAAEYQPQNLAYAVLVQSEIAVGTIADIDDSATRKIPGVLTVVSHKNAIKLGAGKLHGFDNDLLVLQNNKVYHDRQNIAVVVADSLETANYAASLLKVTYNRHDHVQTVAGKNIDAGKAPEDLGVQGESSTVQRGNADAAFKTAPVKLDVTYTTPRENHNPMEPHAITAMWEGDKLTVYEATQSVFGVRSKLAHMFGVAEKNIRVICKFVGGGFGCKGSIWSHVPIAVMAAKLVGRPVCLSMQRQQLYGPVGFRPFTQQRIRLGADSDGKLLSIHHDGHNEVAKFDSFTEPVGAVSQHLYQCANVKTTQKLIELDIGKPTFMRAPGEATGTFGLESAMDELAYKLNIDPIELRMINHAQADQEHKLPYSSKSLEECYMLGSERFGWSRRQAKTGNLRDGKYLVGLGMATATFPVYRRKANARVTISPDGTALVESGSHDLGTGTYTIMTQIAADALGMPLEKVKFDLGDTNMPYAPVSGGSMTAASVGEAVTIACNKAVHQLAQLAASDPLSPLHSLPVDKISGQDSVLVYSEDASRKEPYTAIINRQKKKTIIAEASSEEGRNSDRYSMHSFGAQFAEVRVDPDLRTVRVARWVGVFDCGTILNRKTAMSQMYGGIAMGIGMALMEETLMDERYGRTMNADLAEYHVPVHPDIPPQFEIDFIDKPDYHANPMGAHGIGEISITGSAAAIANAVYNACGVRVRELPITLDKLMV